MRYWVFHEEQLSAALAAREAERRAEGATDEQAKAETLTIVQFLASEAGTKLRGGRGADA